MILFAGDLRREPRSAKNQKHCFDLGFSSHLAPRTSFLYFSHLICHLDGRNQAGGTGLAAPGQIVGGAVVHRGPHNRQAEGDIDSVIKMQELERDQPLVVVHADDSIVAALGGKPEKGVSTVRTTGIDPFVPSCLDGRDNELCLFIAEQTAFSGMRVEGKDRQAWRYETELLT
jgi:hypothetical protein